MRHTNGAAPVPPQDSEQIQLPTSLQPQVPVPTLMRLNVTPRWYLFQGGTSTWKDVAELAGVLLEYDGPLKGFIIGFHATAHGVFIDLDVPVDRHNNTRSFQIAAMELKEAFDGLDQISSRRIRVTSARTAEAGRQQMQAMQAQRAAALAAAPAAPPETEPDVAPHVNSLLVADAALSTKN